MLRSLAGRLTLLYLGTFCIVLLIATFGTVLALTTEFASESMAMLPASRDEAEGLIRTQLRAGRSLADATAYAEVAFHRPDLYLFALDRSNRTVYLGLQKYSSWQIGLANVIVQVYYFRTGFPGDALPRITVPQGLVIVAPAWAHFVDRTLKRFFVVLPYLVAAFAVAWFFAWLIAGHAVRPLREFRRNLQNFSAGDFAPMPISARPPSEVLDLNVAYNAAAAGLRRAVDDRELAAENIRTFISDASHELKTPLTIVMGYVDAVAQGLITESADATRVLNKTLDECRRMRSTIEKLIALARLDRQEGELGSFDIALLALDIENSMRALAADLHLEISVPDATFAHGDKGEIREAIVCVIDNAAKYAPGSPIDMRVSKSASVVVIEIADAGPGMVAEERERAFERFHRGSSQANVEGSGLGLAIAKRAVERARGQITLTSELGAGTTVTIYLPFATPDEPTADAEPVA